MSTWNSYELNEKGGAICRDCRKRKTLDELENCVFCERWVCRDCASYMRQAPFGYVCKGCQREGRNKRGY